MRKFLIAASVVGLAGATSPLIAQSITPGDAHRVKAAEIAGQEYADFARARCYPNERPRVAREDALPPTRVFDNLVFLGHDPRKWNAWALDTSDGIILFDPLLNEHEAERDIVQGLKFLGMDPKRIKYIVIMHGHGDHFGGAPYMTKLTGAPIYMSKEDWDMMIERPAKETKPSSAKYLADGDSLTLGDTTVRFYLTPGHTIGTLSAIIPVKDGKDTHNAVYWGGTVVRGDTPLLDQYINSVERMTMIAAKEKANIYLSNHPTNDVTGVRLPYLATRKSGDPHPFIIGGEGVNKMLNVLRECLLSFRAERATTK